MSEHEAGRGDCVCGHARSEHAIELLGRPWCVACYEAVLPPFHTFEAEGGEA